MLVEDGFYKHAHKRITVKIHDAPEHDCFSKGLGNSHFPKSSTYLAGKLVPIMGILLLVMSILDEKLNHLNMLVILSQTTQGGWQRKIQICGLRSFLFYLDQRLSLCCLELYFNVTLLALGGNKER